MQQILIDEKKPNRYAKDPHELTHSCLTADTMINTASGAIPIKDLVGQQGLVYSYNEQKKIAELNKFFNVRKTRDNAEILSIELTDGRTIKCTPDHRILTQKGWIKASDLQERDSIKEIDYE